MGKILRWVAVAAMFIVAAAPMWGQRLARGEKVPEYQVREWLGGTQPSGGKAVLVEFFHSGNKVSVERLAMLESLAKANLSKMNIVVITREDTPEVRAMLSGKSFMAAIDDEGKTFSAFSALYVPYAVLADKKGYVVWLGNPETLKGEDIQQYIK